jgi:hypothetical protein
MLAAMAVPVATHIFLLVVPVLTVIAVVLVYLRGGRGER